MSANHVDNRSHLSLNSVDEWLGVWSEAQPTADDKTDSWDDCTGISTKLTSSLGIAIPKPVLLGFAGLSCRFRNNSYEEDSFILYNISGKFSPGKLTAILAPDTVTSQCLLRILGGHLMKGQQKGDVLIDSWPSISRARRHLFGYVFSEDRQFRKMRVKEALAYSLWIRAPKDVDKEEQEKRLNDVIKLLQLKSYLNTKIDSIRKNEGVKKRLWVAMELLLDPPLLLMEEPTSEMDQVTAYHFVRHLKQLTELGRTVIASFHKNSAWLFRQFDDVLLLCGNQIIFHGPAFDALDYFKFMGYTCPNLTNPCDFLLFEVIKRSMESGNDKNLIASWKENRHFVERRRSSSFAGIFEGAPTRSAIRESPHTTLSFWYIVRRTTFDTFRAHRILFYRVANFILIGVFAGLVFIEVNKASSFKQRISLRAKTIFSLLSFVYTVNGALALFQQDHELFDREYSLGYYSVSTYYWARFVAEIPLTFFLPYLMTVICYYMAQLRPGFSSFLYSATFVAVAALGGFSLGLFLDFLIMNDAILIEVGFVLILVFFLWSGLGLDNRTLPKYLGWIRYLSTYHWAFEGMMRIEFEPIFEICAMLGDCPKWSRFDAYNINNNLPIGVMMVFAIVTWIGFAVLAYLVLVLRTWYRYRHRDHPPIIPFDPELQSPESRESMLDDFTL